MLLEISEIFRKGLDSKEYAELSDLQRKQRSIIHTALGIEDVGTAADVDAFVSAYTRK